MIKVAPITKGPRAGLWSWQIEAKQKRIQSTRTKIWGKRCGIAMTEAIARSTAERQLRWHREDSAQ